MSAWPPFFWLNESVHAWGDEEAGRAAAPRAGQKGVAKLRLPILQCKSINCPNGRGVNWRLSCKFSTIVIVIGAQWRKMHIRRWINRNFWLTTKSKGHQELLWKENVDLAPGADTPSYGTVYNYICKSLKLNKNTTRIKVNHRNSPNPNSTQIFL